MSKIGRAISLAGAALGGYATGQDMRKRDEQNAEDRAWQKEQRDAQRAEVQREKQNRISLASAAAPTAVEEGAGGALRLESADNRDVDGTAITLAQGKPFRAAGSSFSDRAAAESAAAEYNSEPVTLARVGKAYMAAGDPAKALTLKDAALGLEVKKSQLDEGMRKRANEQFDASLLAASSTADGLAKYMSGSPLIGGAAMKSVISPDGKTVQFMTVGSDGAEKPVGKALPNDPAAWTPLVQGFMKTLTPEKKIEHLFTRHKFETEEAGKAEDRGERKRHNTVTESNAAERIRLQGEATAARIDAATARAGAGGKAPAGYRFKADNTLEPIPGGPADASTKPIKPSKPLTEGQSKSLLFGARMSDANSTIEELAKDGKFFSTPGANTAGLGAAVNLANSKEGQRLDQAKRDFLNAVLRRESGAVIADSEFDNGNRQYFPQIGDKPDVIAQKKRNREIATRGILAEVPEADARVAAIRQQPAATAPAQPARVTSRADVDKLPSGAEFIGPDGVKRRKP